MHEFMYKYINILYGDNVENMNNYHPHAHLIII